MNKKDVENYKKTVKNIVQRDDVIARIKKQLENQFQKVWKFKRPGFDD